MKMKYSLKHAILLMLFLMISSCNDSEKTTTNTSSDQNQILELQKYDIDTSAISILWTAYKFTNKVGVSGTFDTYTLDTKNSSGTVEDILNKSKLSITTASVNSSNAIRDFKLDTYFFKAFNTSEISGTILNTKEGEGVIKLKMNSSSKKIPFTYTIEKDTIQLFTYLNLTHWKGEEALKALNTECYELHKGPDDISKLWPNVDVVIKIPVRKTLMIN